MTVLMFQTSAKYMVLWHARLVLCEISSTIVSPSLPQAELEGQPDVLLTLTTPPGPTHIDHLTVSPTVQSADSQPLLNMSPDGSLAQNRKIR